MRGVIYARYSSDNQREESIDGQIRECKVFAERNGIDIIGSYIDRAFSAKTDNRPDFQRMIKDSAEQIACWLEHFRTFDTNKFEHRRRFIDTFVNRIFLYDDKMVITFNYNKGTKTITFAELEASGILSISNIASTGEVVRYDCRSISVLLGCFFVLTK